MWRRVRRRSFAPTRPAVFAEQIGLLMVTLSVVVLGVVAAVLVFV